MNSKLDSVIAGGLLFALAFTVAAFGSVETWSVSIFELTLAVLTAIWFLKWICAKEIAVDIPPLAIPLIGLVLWGALQSLKLGLGSGPGKSLSLDPGSTLGSVQVFLFMTLALILTVNTFNSRKRYQQLAVFVSVFAFAMAVFALVQHFGWNGAYYWLRASDREGFGPFANRDHFAGYMAMLTPIPIALVLANAVDRQKRALYVFATIIPVIACVASLSRGGMLSLGAEALFLTGWALRFGTRRSRHTARTKLDYLSQGVILAAVLGAIGLGVLWIGAEPIIDRAAQTVQELQTAKADYFSRQQIWRDTLSMVKAHPVSGVGLGAFRTVFPSFSHSSSSLIIAQSHNDYLQILADCGITGALLAVGFLVFLVQAMRVALKSKDRLEAGLALGCSAGSLGMLIHSMFDFNLQIPSNGLLFLFLCGLVSAISVSTRKTASREEKALVKVEDRLALSQV